MLQGICRVYALSKQANAECVEVGGTFFLIDTEYHVGSG